jgi:1-acyl-sn-glycerol-3-phosphate acyltransferase
LGPGRQGLDLGAGSVSWLGRAWRTVATNVCFAVYMPGGLALGVPAYFVVRWIVPSKHRKPAGKALLRLWYRFFVGLMDCLGVVKVRRQDLGLLQEPGRFIVANHPTLIDFVVLGAVLPMADGLVKASLMRHWAMGWPIRMGGYIPNDSGQETLDLCRRALAEGGSLVVFPEGTRSRPGEPLKFHRGAAQLALRSADTLTMLHIDSTPSNLHRGGRWWLAPANRVQMRVRLLEELDLKEWLKAYGGEAALAARALTVALESRYNEELERGSTGK